MNTVYVALDIETTGLEVGVDEIIEVAAVKFNATSVLDTFSQLVRPHQTMPLKIARLTGIDPNDLEQAPPFNDVGKALATFLDDYPLIGHSIQFDLAMLQAQGMDVRQPMYDTFDLATLLLPQVNVYSLVSLAEHLRLPFPDAHRALNDANVTRQVFLHLLRRIQAMNLQELITTNNLIQQTDWPSRELFQAVLREKTSDAWNQSAPRSGAPPLKLRSRDDNGVPLRPTGNASPLEPARISALFAPGGILSRTFPAYEQRSAQVEMAQAVTEAFNQSGVLLVEAGTGTGKSMAYLLPAALFALRRGERVVISTNTINLQDQLFHKDIPDVQRMLAEETRPIKDNGSSKLNWKVVPPANDLQAQILKGRSNYLCLRRYKQLLRDEQFKPHEARALLKVQFWLPETSSGDKSELLLVDDEPLAWSRMNVTVDTCTGHRCPDFHDCFFFQARRRAESAHLVVVNHALLLADIAAESHIIPDYEHLIVDEAHNLEDVATDQLGFSIDQATMLKLLDDLYHQDGTQIPGGLLAIYKVSFEHSTAEAGDCEKADQIAEALQPFIDNARRATFDCFNRLQNVATSQLQAGGNDTRLRLTPGVRRKPEWAEVEQSWENLKLALQSIGSELGKFETLLVQLENADLQDYDELLLSVQWLLRSFTDVRVQIDHIIFGDDETICWLAFDTIRTTLTINAAPLSVADILQAQLFAEKQTSILTSATLSVAESFAYVRERLGLHDPTELQLESPFDYEQQAMVFIPTDIPEPNQRGYQHMLEEALISLCSATQGRTMALFTANQSLRQTYVGIQDVLEERDISVLAQHMDGSRRALLERFKRNPRTVLLGTSSFWEGVDVVGDALSVLVIAKLPFNVPTDPVFAARSEQFKEPFAEYSIPQSILRFKQGFGRLIRSRTDRGIVVVLDKRLISKRYGSQFLQSLPATSVRTGSLKQLPGLAARFLK